MEKEDIVLLDVREEQEWEKGHIEGAENIYVGHLKSKVDSISHSKNVAITCGWGGRGSLAVSSLKKLGFDNIFNILGGMNAWKSLGYPIKKECPLLEHV